MSLLNKAQVKKYALECAKSRAHTFTRVSKSFIDQVEADLMNSVRVKINALPSKGKTIQ